MVRSLRLLALLACLSAPIGVALMTAGCGHEGPGRLPTDTSKRPLMPPGGGYATHPSGMAAKMSGGGSGNPSPGGSGSGGGAPR